MAEFTPKTSEQILKDAIDYLYHNTNLSDFNVGSVIRTILEVMAVEDAEQYFQMFTILESFFLRTASGSGLDDRAKEYDVTRLPATSSIGEVVFLDTNLKRSFLVSALAAGDPVRRGCFAIPLYTLLCAAGRKRTNRTSSNYDGVICR